MIRSVVFDASAIVGFILDPHGHPLMREMVEDEACEILVPHVCDLEIASTLRRVVHRRLADADRAAVALRFYKDLPLERFSHVPFLERVFAMRDNFSAYDAVYVALADVFGACLHTADLQLARAVREHTGVQVAEV
jgi:predicted nucleic acid-binding protein